MMQPAMARANESMEAGRYDFSNLTEDEQDQLVEDSMRDVTEKALFWSQKADMEEMEQVFELFKDSPQDQLILTKIRFEQRIIQVKQVLLEQGKVVDQLRREVELIKIAKAYERSELENAQQQFHL